MALPPDLEQTQPMNNRFPGRRHATGLKPTPAKKRQFSLKRYTTPILLPKIPATFGHYEQLYSQQLGVLGNDLWGDCVPAGAAHIVMAWHAEQNKAVRFSMQAVLADYGFVTGFDPSNPASDQGTSVGDYAAYWRKTGIKDGDGHVHFLAAYLDLTTKGVDEINAACYLFGAVGLGLALPAIAMDQFNNDEPWDIPQNGTSEDAGLHFVVLLGFDGTYYYVATWGQVQRMTPAFLRVYLAEAMAFLSEDMLTGGLSIDGFDMGQLTRDLALLGS